MENTKFDMFASLEEREFEVEEVQTLDESDIELLTASEDEAEEVEKKRPGMNRISRSTEEYNEMIESSHYETLTHPVSGVEYSVKVTVFKPEVNPQENMRPAYAYSTNH
ncbi:hypothetical protein EJP02_071 [Escherichia phage EJP2]|nr:hypothetical protein EJP02_071 [Escherichia phage EJP2]